MKYLKILLILVFIFILASCSLFKPREYTVNFYNKENEIVKTEIVLRGNDATPPELESIIGFTFVNWDTDYTNVKKNLDIRPVYEITQFTITFVDEDNKTLDVVSFNYGSVINGLNSPEIEGYIFEDFYNIDDSKIVFPFEIYANLTIVCKYEIDPNYEFNLPDNMDFSIKNLRVEGNLLKWDTVNNSERYRIYLNDSLLIVLENEEYDLNNVIDSFTNGDVTFKIAAHMTGYKEGKGKEIIVSYIPKRENVVGYYTSIDIDSKGSYEAGVVSLDDGDWYFSDSLIGSTTSDKKNGVKAIRIRSGFIEMQFGVDYVSKLEFYYATYGNDQSNTLSVYAKALNNQNWILLKEFTTTDTLVKGEITKNKLIEHFTPEEVIVFQFQIDNSNQRVNIDDITIYQDLDSYFVGTIKGDYSSYYDGIEGLKENELTLFLRNLLNTDVAGRNYGDAKTVLEIADRHPLNENMVLTIYDRSMVNGPWDSVSWHREHVWPNSRLGVERVTETKINQASDLHNLRAIVPSVNSSRSNRVYSDGNGAWTTIGTDAFYPGDSDKGDVARILFYMVVKYDVLSLVDEILPNDPITNYKLEGAKMSMLSSLLKWHKEDPVDDFERTRNDVIYTYQNNRNPFIDYPHLVELIYGPININNKFDITLLKIKKALEIISFELKNVIFNEEDMKKAIVY